MVPPVPSPLLNTIFTNFVPFRTSQFMMKEQIADKQVSKYILFQFDKNPNKLQICCLMINFSSSKEKKPRKLEKGCHMLQEALEVMEDTLEVAMEVEMVDIKASIVEIMMEINLQQVMGILIITVGLELTETIAMGNRLQINIKMIRK